MTKIRGRVLLGSMNENEQIQFFDSNVSNVFSSNLNPRNSKLFCNHSEIYSLEKKIKKYSGEINPLRVHKI